MNIKKKECEARFMIHAFFVLMFILVCRIIASYFIPLNDATEARYGEIARKMLETQNWVTLQHDYGVPFWAKPPLSTWLSACSMNFFGVNEFAVRLPELLLSITVLWLIWICAKKHSGRVMATAAALVLAGALFFFLNAGAVMTDPALVFCTTLSMVAFWNALSEQRHFWSYLFFIGLGLGFLAKGPLILILSGMPIFFWVLLRHEWQRAWQKLPWIKGTFLLSCIALPWYIWAELRTPGFLNYFIVGEHLHRFLTPGWSGDRYGAPHYAPMGMIWLYAVAGFAPWSVMGGVWLAGRLKVLPSLVKDDDGWLSYLFLCTVVPLVFFTFASNIIYPYVFPVMPAFALMFAELCHRNNPSLNYTKWILNLSLVSSFVALIVTSMFIIKPELIAHSQKELIAIWNAQHPLAENKLIYWGSQTPFSAQFYSAGRAESTERVHALCQLFSNESEHYLVVDAKKLAEIPHGLLAQLTKVSSLVVKHDVLILFKGRRVNC